MERTQALRTLRAAYMAGGLTPFIGAGMSMGNKAGGLAGWAELVLGLEEAAALPAGDGVVGDHLVARADRAATRLRTEGLLPAAIRKHLGTLPTNPSGDPLAAEP